MDRLHIMSQTALDILHWVGSIIAFFGFYGMTSKVRRTRWWGALLSLVSAAALLIPWAIMEKHYGLLLLWVPISWASVRGMMNNRSEMSENHDDTKAEREHKEET